MLEVVVADRGMVVVVQVVPVVEVMEVEIAVVPLHKMDQLTLEVELVEVIVELQALLRQVVLV